MIKARVILGNRSSRLFAFAMNKENPVITGKYISGSVKKSTTGVGQWRMAYEVNAIGSDSIIERYASEKFQFLV